MSEKKSILKDKSFEFAVTIIRLYKKLVEIKKEYVLSRQLLKSGTAIGAMIRESQNAESKNDFIHKLAIAQKECDETLYWLELLYETNFLDIADFETAQNDALGLLKMIRSSILTTKQLTLNAERGTLNAERGTLNAERGTRNAER